VKRASAGPLSCLVYHRTFYFLHPYRRITEFDDREQGSAQSAAPVETYAAEGLRFDYDHTSTSLSGPNRCSILAWSGAQNGDVFRHGRV
jgi:hypothetical protein